MVYALPAARRGHRVLLLPRAAPWPGTQAGSLTLDLYVGNETERESAKLVARRPRGGCTGLPMTFDVWLVATAAIAASTSIAPLVDSSSDMVVQV